MKVAIAGGTGFIGQHLVRELVRRGYEVVVISRSTRPVRQSGVSVLTWEELDREPQRLDGLYALVNLAGETINQRWTNAAKERILSSRIEATQAVARLVERLAHKPAVVVNGSAVGYYGMSETETFTEESRPGARDFLAEVVARWEAEAEAIPTPRLVLLRTGVVFGREGGAFPKMALPYRLFIGGNVGSGRQWLSWIAVEDLVRLIAFCIETDRMAGPVNAVALQPVTNEQFGRTLGRVMKRPHWLPVPGFMMRLLFGEMADLLLKGQRVLPQKALANGFSFTYNTLEEALKELV
jgi:uncharacterized protein (TIGR01777 family)